MTKKQQADYSAERGLHNNPHRWKVFKMFIFSCRATQVLPNRKEKYLTGAVNYLFDKANQIDNIKLNKD